MGRVPLNITMDEDTVKAIKKQAIDENTDVSKIIEKLVKEYLDKTKAP